MDDEDSKYATGLDSNEHAKVMTLEQLPDNPLTMPPPYWRSSGAVFHVLDALESLISLLEKLLPVHEQTELQLEEYYKSNPNENDDPDLENFSGICDELWSLEHKIQLKTEIAVLMSAVAAEDRLNMFCVFNLRKDVAESIEKLSLSEKLLIATAVVEQPSVKGDTVFEALKKLTQWRNAFAHGHCVDRPVKSLRHNHLISPSTYPGVPDSLAKLKELVSGYLRLSDYLKSISVNPYTSGGSVEVEEIRGYLTEISHYTFDVFGNSSDVYLPFYKSNP